MSPRTPSSRNRSQVALRGVAVVLAAAVAIGALVLAIDPDGRPASASAAGGRKRGARLAGRAGGRGIRAGGGVQPAAHDRLIRHRVLLGHSVKGRPIVGIALGDPDAARKLLVVGIIHGNETAGRAIAKKLASGPPPRRSLLWIVPDLNPDGVAAGTRQNAHGVDLNRNFPWHRGRARRLGGLEYAGPRALSEPEARLARRLILRVRPRVTIWYHQPLGLVDESGGRVGVERLYAHLTGLPLSRLTRYPGSAINWENRQLPGSTAFAVELPPGRPTPGLIGRNVRAVRRLARPLLPS